MIANFWNERDYIEVLRYDLSKDVDCIDHEILLEKLYYCGKQRTTSALQGRFVDGEDCEQRNTTGIHP